MIQNVMVYLIVMFLVLSSGCTLQENKSEETTVHPGDTITIDFTGWLDNENHTVVMTTDMEAAKKAGLYVPGTIYRPFTFKVGDDTVYQGLNEGVTGMTIGETKILTIPPEKGSGMPVKELFISLPLPEIKANFGGNVPGVGTEIALANSTLDRFTTILIPDPYMKGRVIQVNDTHILVDFNYIYTGKTIMLETTVRSILRGT